MMLSPLIDLPVHRLALTSCRRAVLLACCFLLCAVVGQAAEVRELKIGSPERKAIMETMRGPVSNYVGKRVTFTGKAKTCGNWATFDGGVAPTDGVMPKGDVAFEMELDFFALLRLEKGEWKLLLWGFAGDVGLLQDARKKFPQVPKELVPVIP